MHHDPTFWLLARASGLTAYVLLTLSVLAGLVLKSRPFRTLRAADRRRGAQDARADGPRRTRAARAPRSCSTRPSRSASRRCSSPGSSRYRPAAVAAGVVAAWLLVVVDRVVLGAAAHRHANVAAAALAHLRALRPRDDPRDRRRHRHGAAVGAGLYLGAARRRRRRDRLARPRSTSPPAVPRPRKEQHHEQLPHRRSTRPSAAASAPASTSPRRLFRLEAGGVAAASHGGDVRPRSGRSGRRLPDGRDLRVRGAEAVQAA